MRVVGSLFLVFALTIPSYAWGTTAHRLIHEKAIESLPEGSLKAFLTAHRNYIISNSVLPDRWKNHDKSEGPRHYIDLEYYGGLPFTEKKLRERPAESEYSWGIVPWQIAATYDSLVMQIKKRRSLEALRAFAVLGHYVTDAHVPLHTTTNHNGQETGDTGIHSRWESDFVEFLINELKAESPPRPAISNKRVIEQAWRYVRDAHPSIDSILANDRIARAKDPDFGDAYLAAITRLGRENLEARLQHSIQDLAGLWMKSWKSAGNPTLENVSFVDVTLERGDILISDTSLNWSIRWADVGTVPFSSATLLIKILDDKQIVKALSIPIRAGATNAKGQLPVRPKGKIEIQFDLSVTDDVETGNNDQRLR